MPNNTTFHTEATTPSVYHHSPKPSSQQSVSAQDSDVVSAQHDSITIHDPPATIPAVSLSVAELNNTNTSEAMPNLSINPGIYPCMDPHHPDYGKWGNIYCSPEWSLSNLFSKCRVKVVPSGQSNYGPSEIYNLENTFQKWYNSKSGSNQDRVLRTGQHYEYFGPTHCISSKAYNSLMAISHVSGKQSGAVVLMMNERSRDASVTWNRSVGGFGIYVNRSEDRRSLHLLSRKDEGDDLNRDLEAEGGALVKSKVDSIVTRNNLGERWPIVKVDMEIAKEILCAFDHTSVTPSSRI